MRKIISKYEENRIKKKNKFLMGFILIFIMSFGVVGYSFGGKYSGGKIPTNDGSNKINYNGFEATDLVYSFFPVYFVFLAFEVISLKKCLNNL